MSKSEVKKDLGRVLSKEATCANFAQVRDEGGRSVNREIEFYNLDAIISVGYRVNSIQATNFRIWATERLREYIISDSELEENSVIQNFRITAKDGKNSPIFLIINHHKYEK